MSNRNWYWCRNFSTCVLYNCWYWLFDSAKRMAHVTDQNSGAAYLVYLGWQCLRSQPNTTIEINVQAGSDTPSLFKAFTMGFLTNALNPKATIFFWQFYDDCKYGHTNESSGFLWCVDVYGQCHLVYGGECTVCTAYCT